MRPSLSSCLAMLAALFLANTLACAQSTIRIENGLIKGTQSADGKVDIYKAIPFAAPPVSNLRWKAPQSAHNWPGTRDCTRFAASAVQPPPVPFFVWSQEFMAPPSPLGEDCLYLNVWSPATSASPSEKRPVIVWIHGGGFMSGAGSCPIYDGEGMARKGVVFVTINYRLGVFGFLAHPELSKESGNNASGNYAFLDQIAALQWVQRNIATFGGDPDRVTIAGQSAGAFAVNALMASPLAKGLFQRAIGQSGGMFGGDRPVKLAEASLQGIALVKKLGKKNIAELRHMPPDSLLKLAVGFNTPVLDGHVLPIDVYTIFSEGKQNDVPLLTGYNRDEGFLFGEGMNAEAFQADAQGKYGNLAAEFLKVYPASNDAEAKQSQRNLSRDQIFAWQTYTWARLQSAHGQSKAWLYRFDRVPPGRDDLSEHGAFHSAEIAYALNTLPMWDRPWQPLDRQLSEQMSGYWANFAATGDPNGKGLPKWEAYRPAAHNVLIFNEKTGIQKEGSMTRFAFLDKWRAANTPDLEEYQESHLTHGGDTLLFRELFPEDYDPDKKYPLVVFLHGAGERGNDNKSQLAHGASLFLKPENRRNFPCIVVFPQCPSEAAWHSASADRTKSPPVRDFNYTNAEPHNLSLVVELIESYIREESVDPDRIYITGLSMGGMGTFEAVARYPDLFAAAAPICGGGDLRAFKQDMPKTPMRIFHGDADSVVDVKYSRLMYSHLYSLGWPVEYVEYPAVEHNSWDYAFAERDFLAWLFSKNR